MVEATEPAAMIAETAAGPTGPPGSARCAIRAAGLEDLSHAELAEVSRAVADDLSAAGLRAGDTIAVFMPPRADTAVVILAAMTSTCVAPLNPALPAAALSAALSRLRPAILVVSADAPDWVAEVADRLDVPVAPVVPDGTGRAGAIRLNVPPMVAGRRRLELPADTGLLLQTSGSTGIPKLVPLNRSQIKAGADALVRSLGLGSADTVLHTLPMHHVGGIIDLLVAPLSSGGTVVIAGPFSAPSVLSAVSQVAPTWLQLAPAMLAELLEEAESGGPPPDSLRLIRSVSAPLPLELLERAEDRFRVPLVEIYGMTETAGVITSNPVDGRRPGTVGRPVDTEVEIVGADGARLPAGVEGEVLVRGQSVFGGYLAEHDDTPEDPFIDGWLRTGDLGICDADGYLRITGRLKDAINRGGETISPAAIDRELLSHPDVADAAAFGMPHPTLGEIPAAVVVTRPDATTSVRQLQDWVGERLAPAMVPRPIVLVDRIPRPGGKLRRADLRALLPDQRGSRTGDCHVERVDVAALVELWADVLGLATIDPDSDFFAMGGDSLKAARLVARLGEKTGDIIYAQAVFEAPTPLQLAEHLARNFPRAAAALAGSEPATTEYPPVTESLIERFRTVVYQPRVSDNESGRNPRAAFILSAPRSGSTLLRAMLAGHPGLFAPPELYMLAYPDLAERSRHFAPPQSSQLEGAVRALMAAEGLDPAAASERMRKLEADGCTTAEFYGLLQAAVDGRLLVDKTPANALSVNTLRRAEACFTEPVYIHLVRHPSAMTASFVEANLASLWTPRIIGPDAAPDLLAGIAPSQLGELLWLQLNANIEEFLAEVPRDRVARLRFEDLVDSPASALIPLCELLGVEFSPLLLDPYDHSGDRMTDGLHDESRMIGDPKFHSHRGIDPARGNRWRTDGSGIVLSNPTRTAAARYRYDDSGESGVVTAAQWRVWSLSRLDPDSSVYCVPLVFRLRGELDLPALGRALTALAQRHGALRACFPADDNGRPQLVITPARPVEIPLNHCESATEKELLRLAEAEVHRPFELSAGPLWRAAVLRAGARDNLLVMTFHHIVFDGFSRNLFVEELGALYAAEVSGTAAPLPPAPSYPAIIRRQSDIDADAAGRNQDYWETRFAEPAQQLILPADHPRPEGPGHARSVRLSMPGFGVKLDQFCRERGATPAALWLAAMGTLLSRLTGQDDLLVCVPTAGRHTVASESAIGYLNRVVPVRLDLADDPAACAVVQQATARIAEAIGHDGLPLQQLAASPGLARISLSTLLVSYQELPDDALRLPGLDVQTLPVRRKSADFDLAVHIERRPSGVELILDYHAGLFEDASVSGLARLLAQTVAHIVDNPDQRLSRIPAAAITIESIEALLTAHPKVDEAAVSLRSGHLVAHLVLNENDVPCLAEINEYTRAALPAYRVPEAFVPVGQLPRTAAGEVDKRALPEPLDGLRSAGSAPPRDSLEGTIAQLWRKVLWLDDDVHIGREDSFRGLGGHSLLAVQMIGLLEAQLGQRLPPVAVARLDTIAGLAAALRSPDASISRGESTLDSGILAGLLAHTRTWSGTRHHEDAVTVGLNTGGSRPALFWCLQNNAEHESLARNLGPEQPVYGMRSGNRVMEKSDENIAALARHYVGEILQIQQEGPYMVGGNCQAARIAIRIARELRAAGHSVPVLFMMEKFDPVDYDGAVVMLFGADSDRNPFHQFTEPHLGYRKFYRGPIWIREIPGQHGRFFVEPNAIPLAALIGEHLSGALDPGRLSAPPAARGAGPRPLSSTAYNANVELVARSAEHLDVVVSNLGAEEWPDGPTGGIGLGCRWFYPRTGKRTLAGIWPMASSTPVGASVEMRIPIPAPPTGRRGLVRGRRLGDSPHLEVDVVEQGVTWFSDLGSTPLLVDKTDVATGARW